MAQIGQPLREIHVEPLEIPVPRRETTPAAPTPMKTPEPDKVPA